MLLLKGARPDGAGVKEEKSQESSGPQRRLWRWMLHWGTGLSSLQRPAFWRWALHAPVSDESEAAIKPNRDAILNASAEVDPTGFTELVHGLGGAAPGCEVAGMMLSRMDSIADLVSEGSGVVMPFGHILKELMRPPFHLQRLWLLTSAAVPWLVSQARCFQITLAAHCPKLLRHLMNEGVAPELFFCHWIQRLFHGCLPPYELMQIWDLFIYEQSHKIFIRVAVAIFWLLENRIIGRDIDHVMKLLFDPSAWAFNSGQVLRKALETKITRSMLSEFGSVVSQAQ